MGGTNNFPYLTDDQKLELLGKHRHLIPDLHDRGYIDQVVGRSVSELSATELYRINQVFDNTQQAIAGVDSSAVKPDEDATTEEPSVVAPSDETTDANTGGAPAEDSHDGDESVPADEDSTPQDDAGA